MHGGRWWAHCLRLLLLLLLLLLRVPQSPPKPCSSTAPGECRKGTETSIHGGEDEAQVVQVGRIKQAAKMGQGVPLVLVPLLPFFPF